MLTFEYIQPHHTSVIEGFQCPDEPSVERFLKEKALMLHKLRSAVTRLYFDENQNLVGYFTLYNDHIHVFSNQRAKHGWQLADDIDQFPGVKIHYFGVDIRHRGKHYGAYLLAESMFAINAISQNSGCNFITVEALENAIPFYEKYGFVLRQRTVEGFHHMAFKLDELW